MERLIVDTIDFPQLSKKRNIRIYLPKDYDICKNKRYPVLYMHDGQNIFDKSNMSFGDYSWNVHKTINELEKDDTFSGLILVGIDNDSNNRFNEYSPWKCEAKEIMPGENDCGGKGNLYGEFVAKTLKEYIDNKYRTLPDKENTFLAGSSMGGLITLYIGIKYDNIFSKLGIFSPAVFFAEKSCKEFMDSKKSILPQKYYIYAGDNETVNSKYDYMPKLFVYDAKYIKTQLIKTNVSENNIKLVIGKGETHSEKSWQKYFVDFLLM